MSDDQESENRSSPTADAFRQTLLELLDDALARLSDAPDPEAVHETRKRLKEARAILRLLEPAAGSIAQRARVALRDAGRTLASTRDAYAVVESFDRLVERFSPEWGPRSFASLRRALVERHQPLQIGAAAIDAIKTTISAIRTDAAVWTPIESTSGAIERQFRRSYAGARRAMQIALRERTPDALHEWRIRTKECWIQLRGADNLWPGLAPDTPLLRDLSRILGEHHDLVLLRRASMPLFRRSHDSLRFDAFLQQRLHELEREARFVGERALAEKPRRWMERMERIGPKRAEKRAAVDSRKRA